MSNNHILFVCLGNICRSPLAQGVMESLKSQSFLQLHVESCGLGDWHQGQLPDPRMRETALSRGLVLASRAQEFKPEFFDRFDWILVADHHVKNELLKRAKTAEDRAKIHLMTKFSKLYPGAEIPDPFYGNTADFELVMDMVEDACKGLLEHLENQS